MNNTPINPLDYATPEKRQRPKTSWLAWVVLVFLAWGAFEILTDRDPSLPAGQTANRLKCADNLRRLGAAIIQYTIDHAGQYPDSLGTLLLNEDITAAAFIRPGSNDVASAKPTKREQAAEIDGGTHCSYRYLGRGMTINPVTRDCVIVYEPLASDGMNVLFGDGHVEFAKYYQAKFLLDQVAVSRTAVRIPDLPTTRATGQ